jgi:ketosteroid isomerase-like protein
MRKAMPLVSEPNRAAAGDPAVLPSDSLDGQADEVTTEELVADLYRAFNERRIDLVLASLSDDVDWPNAWQGGRLHGRDAVREYWTRQWSEIDPHVEPTHMTTLADGRVAVRVRQTVHALDGSLLSEGEVTHVYVFDEGLIRRMDVEP